MDDEECYYTGMDISECPCMSCQIPVFLFKYMLVDYQIDNIDDVISALGHRKAFFLQLKKDGFRLMDPVDDHYAEFEPPDSEEFYWVECKSGGCYLKSPRGEIPPRVCPECGKNLYEYEE